MENTCRGLQQGEWKPTNAKDSITSQCEILPLMSEVKGFSTEKGVLSLNPSRPHPKCYQGVLQAQAAPFKRDNHRPFSLKCCCPRVYREPVTQAEHQTLPQIRNPAILIIESKQASL